MKTRHKMGMTLVEVLIVIVVMSIISAVIVTQYLGNLEDSTVTMARYNLSRLRYMLQLYGARHETPPSASLTELLAATDAAGQIGTGSAFPYGPYLADLPTNPLPIRTW